MDKTPLEVARERKAAREAVAAKKLDDLELEALTLEETYEAKGKELGVDFAVVSTGVGNFVIGNPEFMVAKTFADIPADKKSVEDVIKFVDPCVLYPEKMAARAVFQEHAGVAWKCCTAALKLHEADTESIQKK